MKNCTGTFYPSSHLQMKDAYSSLCSQTPAITVLHFSLKELHHLQLNNQA